MDDNARHPLIPRVFPATSAGMNAPLSNSAASPIALEVARRRTFAIISHPDAGKTTLTEKLLYFGGAIQLAGEIGRAHV